MNKLLILLFTILSINLCAQKSIKLVLNVVNEYTNENISFANVKIVNISTNQIKRLKTNFKGELNIDLQSNMKYKLYANSESDSTIVIFNEKNINFNTEGVQLGTKITSNIKLRPTFQRDGIIHVSSINFSIFTYTLDNIAKAKLDNVIQVLQQNPEINIDVTGYASCNLTEDDANNVSVARATAVFTYLTDAGIDYSRIGATAWGKDLSKALTKCKCEVETKKDKPCTKKHHVKNSRVGLVYKNI